jgi:hypothetical protein
MKRKWQWLVVLFALAVAAVVVPAAAGVGPGSPGVIPSNLGSPDPREHAQGSSYFAGLVPTRLGSQDSRDTARASLGVSFTPHR